MGYLKTVFAAGAIYYAGSKLIGRGRSGQVAGAALAGLYLFWVRAEIGERKDAAQARAQGAAQAKLNGMGCSACNYLS